MSLPSQDNLLRFTVSVAHRFGWVTFVRAEIIETYLTATPGIAWSSPEIAALVGGGVGVILAIFNGIKLTTAPSEMQSTLVFFIVFPPLAFAILGIILQKTANSVSRGVKALALRATKGSVNAANGRAFVG